MHIDVPMAEDDETVIRVVKVILKEFHNKQENSNQIRTLCIKNQDSQEQYCIAVRIPLRYFPEQTRDRLVVCEPFQIDTTQDPSTIVIVLQLNGTFAESGASTSADSRRLSEQLRFQQSVLIEAQKQLRMNKYNKFVFNRYINLQTLRVHMISKIRLSESQKLYMADMQENPNLMTVKNGRNKWTRNTQDSISVIITPVENKFSMFVTSPPQGSASSWGELEVVLDVCTMEDKYRSLEFL